MRNVYLTAIAFSLFIAITATYFASTSPDGLEKYLPSVESNIKQSDNPKDTSPGKAAIGTLAVLVITFALGRIILGVRRRDNGD